MLLCPHVWNEGKSEEILARELGEAFSMDAFLFYSGREALLALMRALQLQPSDEVIVQGYTCAVVGNAVRAAGGKPVYVDIDKETLNIDPENIERAVTERTRAIICQHTFGIPANIELLRAICDEKSLALIEDCAHVIPDASGPKNIGTKGDFLLLSFGRDKAISGVAGGAVLSRHRYVSTILMNEWKNAVDVGRWTTLRLLLYPWIYSLARPLYGLWLGKAFLAACRALGLLLPILSPLEKEGGMAVALRRMPNACAYLALDQWRRRGAINDHRRMLTKKYLQACADHGWPVLRGIRDDLPLQKFPLFIAGYADDDPERNRRVFLADDIRQRLKKGNIHLDDGWTGCVVCPASVDAAATGYARGSDPRAEEAAESILSLPTHPTMTKWQAELLIEQLNSELQRTNHA
jgi:dTDP-4-amino-4,6-dideoxygalactose transaminase